MASFKAILKNLLFVTFVICFTTAYSQEVKTKDGVSMGNRKDFISECIKGFQLSEKETNGIKITEHSYCACFCDNLIPNIYSWDLERALKEDNLAELLVEESNYKIFMDCIDKNIKLPNDYKFEYSKNSESYKIIAMKTCIDEIMNDDEIVDDFWTKEIAEKYCDCALTKMLNNGYTYEDLQKIEDENSTAYNEVVLPCISELLEDKTIVEPENFYDINDIKGENSKSEIPLIDILGQGFKLKILIGGVERYFLFDTGASDLIIDRDTERDLLIEGVIKKESYLYKSEYKLANNQIINAQMVSVDNIRIGGYTVNNVIIGIIDEGSLLCGKSFLDKFKKWELDSKNKVLILYK